MLDEDVGAGKSAPDEPTKLDMKLMEALVEAGQWTGAAQDNQALLLGHNPVRLANIADSTAVTFARSVMQTDRAFDRLPKGLKVKMLALVTTTFQMGVLGSDLAHRMLETDD